MLQLVAPIGFSELNPISTLVQRAIDLGLSPNQAVQAISSVLQLPAGIKLSSYNAYQILQSNPSDANALAMELVAVQVVHVSPTTVEAADVYVLAAQGWHASDVFVPAAMRTEPAAHDVDHGTQAVPESQ